MFVCVWLWNDDPFFTPIRSFGILKPNSRWIGWGGGEEVKNCLQCVEAVSSVAFQRKYSLSFFNIFIWLFLRMIKTHWDISNRFPYTAFDWNRSDKTKIEALNLVRCSMRFAREEKKKTKIPRFVYGLLLILLLLSIFLLFSSSFAATTATIKVNSQAFPFHLLCEMRTEASEREREQHRHVSVYFGWKSICEQFPCDGISTKNIQNDKQKLLLEETDSFFCSALVFVVVYVCVPDSNWN